ncbi:hypothetical protein JHK86_035086 [Glycine max]|nr:hypothetical protein JHK86_035086 [Glycine max]
MANHNRVTRQSISSEIMDEDQKNWNEMAKVMMMVNKKPTDMFNTIHIKDQSYGEVSRSFVVRWKDELEHTWHLLDSNDKIHSIKYNQDLQNPTIVPGWTELGDYYGLTDAKFTHVNLEGTIECKIVYNHWRKSAKIGSGWKSFTNSKNLEASQEIIFEFPNPKSNSCSTVTLPSHPSSDTFFSAVGDASPPMTLISSFFGYDSFGDCRFFPWKLPFTPSRTLARALQRGSSKVDS